MAHYYYNKYNATASTTYSNPTGFSLYYNTSYSPNHFNYFYDSYVFYGGTLGFWSSGSGVNFPAYVGQVAYSSMGQSSDRYTANSFDGTNYGCTRDHATSTATITYSQGSLVTSNIVAENGTYPDNGYYVTDGYWYVKQGPATPSTECDVLTFSLAGVAGTINGTTISVTVPYGTTLNPNSTGIFTLSAGASASPVSGASTNWSGSPTILVSAQDGTTTKSYTISISVAPQSLEFGDTCIDRSANSNSVFGATLYTVIVKTVAAPQDGILNKVEIWASTNMAGVQIGVFTPLGSENYTTRSYCTIGSVTAGAKRAFTGLSLAVHAGDFIGIYWTGGYIEEDLSGAGTSLAYKQGIYIPCTNAAFTAIGGYPMSLRGFITPTASAGNPFFFGMNF